MMYDTMYDTTIHHCSYLVHHSFHPFTHCDDVFMMMMINDDDDDDVTVGGEEEREAVQEDEDQQDGMERP